MRGDVEAIGAGPVEASPFVEIESQDGRRLGQQRHLVMAADEPAQILSEVLPERIHDSYGRSEMEFLQMEPPAAIVTRGVEPVTLRDGAREAEVEPDDLALMEPPRPALDLQLQVEIGRIRRH